MSTLIVLDTTETFADLRLEGLDYALLRSYVSGHPVTLLVPQIVVEETINHYKEQLATAVEQVKAGLRAIKRLAPNLTDKLDFHCDLDEEVAAYRDNLQKKLKSLHAQQPSYDAIRMSLLVRRALERRKPFDSKGGGFRDSLLWESVLECLKAQSPDAIVLVTKNKRDFGEHGKLADHLTSDLSARGYSHVAVTVCEGLRRFVEERVKPSLETLHELQEQLNDGEYESLDPFQFFADSSDYIRDALAKEVKQIDLDRLTSQSVFDYRHPTLGQMSNHADECQVIDVWRIKQDELGIAMDFKVAGTISCLQESRMGPDGEPGEEEYEGQVLFTLQLEVVFNERKRQVESWELHGVVFELAGDWGFREPD